MNYRRLQVRVRALDGGVMAESLEELTGMLIRRHQYIGLARYPMALAGFTHTELVCRCARLCEGRYRKRSLEKASSILNCIAVKPASNHEYKVS